MSTKNRIEEEISEWISGSAKSVTFVVTEDCQLDCRYCYFVDKNTNNKMDFVVAKRTIDYLLSHKEVFTEDAVIFDFIGGEPFLEVELIDKICDYFKLKAFKEGHKWFDAYRFNLSSNGLLYNSKRVQKFIKKNLRHLDISISIDGTKQKHDMHRKYSHGKGSYNDTIKIIPIWLEQFPTASTKVTISSDDIPYIRESVLHLFKLNIKYININVVFEDVWKEGDDIRFEQQLFELADDILEREFYKDYTCSFFNRTIGKPVKDNGNWCGSGKMLAVDHTGNFYPCVRFTPFSLKNKKSRIIGNCYDGIDFNKQRSFLALTMTSQSNKECIECDVASGCAWCQGFNYDSADSDTIYQRATFICKMHKARVRANNYFWGKYDEKVRTGNE